MLKKLLAKKGEGVLTGILWMAVVGIVSGAIAYSMWGSAGIGGAATTSKATPSSSLTTQNTAAAAIAH